MKFYHRTTESIWERIQEEGVLWGVHKNCRRYTYLAPEECIPNESYGVVLLEVEYEPHGVGISDINNKPFDNYGFNPPKGQICWQFSVFKPIPISDIKRIDEH